MDRFPAYPDANSNGLGMRAKLFSPVLGIPSRLSRALATAKLSSCRWHDRSNECLHSWRNGGPSLLHSRFKVAHVMCTRALTLQEKT